MASFSREVDSILLQLRGSPWAGVAGVSDVVQEYTEFKGTSNSRHRRRRVSLQILYASRAIDSLLSAIVNHERAKLGLPARDLTIGASLAYIRRHSIGGQRFNLPTEAALHGLRATRNQFLHKANNFPSDPELLQFLTITIRALGEATTFPV